MKNTSAANISRETAIHLPASPLSKTESMIWCSVFSVASFLIVIGNFFTIILFKSNKRFRKRSLLFVINMAFADLILGTLAPLVSYVFLYHHRYEKLSALDGKRRFLVDCSLFLHNHLHVFVDGVFEFCGFNIVREFLRHILAI